MHSDGIFRVIIAGNDMLKVKICGITNIEDAMLSAEYGADALGFIFYKKSPRYIEPEAAGEITRRLPPFISTVGVFVDEPVNNILEIRRIVGIDIVQLHGNESPDVCRAVGTRAIKAFRIKSEDSVMDMPGYAVSAYLLDAYQEHAPGGTGSVFNWDIAVAAKRFGKIILAGGLNPDNVEQAVKKVLPYAVDVVSGVEESAGRKDRVKLRDFITRAKGNII